MIINGRLLLEEAPIKNMFDHKVQAEPTSYGLTECGYDIRLAQEVRFVTYGDGTKTGFVDSKPAGQMFVLGSSIEEFEMPNSLMGRVLNKSTWARKGLDASMTTNIEPGWKGWLTLELVYHGYEDLIIPAGSGICQVIFERISVPTQYKGKYQNQRAEPVEAITRDQVNLEKNTHYCTKCGFSGNAGEFGRHKRPSDGRDCMYIASEYTYEITKIQLEHSKRGWKPK